MATVPVGPEPCEVVCPSCSARATTRVEHASTTKTHLIALLLCVLGCCPCAACLYCTDCARNTVHYCPECNNYIGTYEK